jgi:hypothetical protein
MALGGGQGQAIVLDNPRDPLAIYNAGQRQQAQDAYRQQQLGLKQQQQNDNQLAKALSFKYEDPGDRFRSFTQDIVNGAMQATLNEFQNAPYGQVNQGNILNIKGNAQKQINYIKELNNVYDEKSKALAGMKNVDQAAATAIMNQAISKANPYEVDQDLIQNIEQVPAIYDLNSMVANSVKDVKDQYRSTDPGQIQSSPLGLFMEVTDQKLRFKDLDKTMDYILRGNDTSEEGLNQKVNGGVISDRIRYSIAQDQIAKAGGDPNDVNQVLPEFKKIQYDGAYAPQVRQKLRGILEQLNQEDRDVNIQKMGQFRQESAKERDYRNAKTARERALDSMMAPFGKNGELSAPDPLAQQSLAKTRNADFAGGKIIGAKYERGGYTIAPEWMDRLSRVINTPEGYATLAEAVKHLVPVKGNANKVRFTTKTGTMFGSPETQIDVPLDLSDPAAKVILNAMMNQNPGERKVYFDDLYQTQQPTNQVDIGLPEDEDLDFEDQ